MTNNETDQLQQQLYHKKRQILGALLEKKKLISWKNAKKKMNK